MESSRHGRWADRLARALDAVYETGTSNTEELAERNPLEERWVGASAVQPPVLDPVFGKCSLCHRTSRNKTRIPGRRFAPLRLALCSAEEILGEHTALGPYSTSEAREQEFQLAFLDGGSNTRSRLDIVAALVCRARQIGEDGYRAAQELKSLLDRSLGDGHGNVPDFVTTGYHAWLFSGLELGEEVEIADGMTAAPLDRPSACLERKVLARATPDIVARKEWQVVGAILKPVQSRPVPFSPDEQRVPRLDWVGTFFEDAGTLVEWLSVVHAEPIDTLTEISYCTHRTAVLLVGAPSRPRNCRYRRCQSARLSLVQAGPSARVDGLVEAVAAERAFPPGGTEDSLDALPLRCPRTKRPHFRFARP